MNDNPFRFQIGDNVIARHHSGHVWRGQVTYRAVIEHGPDDKAMVEYEVSGAPVDRQEFSREHYPESAWLFEIPGMRWHPLLWDEEVFPDDGQPIDPPNPPSVEDPS